MKPMLNKAQAARLVKRINESVEITVALIIEAFEGRAHLALGYKNWQSFADAELPHYKYSPADRAKASADLTEAGLSTRSAAAALGVSKSAVARDVEAVAVPDGTVAGEDSNTETAPEETTTESAPTPPVRIRKPKKNRAVAAAGGAGIKQQVDEYRAVMAKHPTWTVKSVQDHLGISHQDVGRRRLWSQAPGEAQTYLYSGQITSAVAETVLSNAYVSDEDKLVVLRKFTTGVITTTGAPRVRAIMELIPQIQPYPELVLRWSSPDLKMTVEQLQEELIDIRNNRTLAKKEQAQKAAEAKMLAESGFNAMAWLDEMAEQLDLVDKMWPVLSANSWVHAKLVRKLTSNGNRMIQLAERKPVSGPAEEHDDTSVIPGEIVT